MSPEQKDDLTRDRRKALVGELDTLRKLMEATRRPEAARIITKAIDWIDGTGEPLDYDGFA